jgi:hypothetical protein
MCYSTLPLIAVLRSIIQLHVGLTGPKMMTNLFQIKDAVLGKSAHHTTHIDLHTALAGKVAALCMPIGSPLKCNLEDLKKVPDS